MMYSMTGFANSNKNYYDQWNIDIQIKSVNHRYLNISFKTSDEFSFLEPKVNALITNFISRGKVECRINIQHNNNALISLNTKLANQLIELNKKLIRESNIKSLTTADLLKFPGILQKEQINFQSIEPLLLNQVKDTCELLNTSRKQEGNHLKHYLTDKLNQIDQIITNILKNNSQYVHDYLTQLTAKIQNLLKSTIDPDRLNQEIALYIQKIDIDEELCRIQAHIQETKNLLDNDYPHPTGKRMDFLMQEFNRETNTLASKANHVKITQAGIELKVLIEQMREQIQNIE